MNPSGPRLEAVHGVGIALACWAVLALLHVFGAFTIADLGILDVHYGIRGEQPASDRLALVEIDDETIAEYGQWPLPRETYAVLIAALEEAGARTIGLDLLFLGEDDNPEGDRLLAGLTSLQQNVVHAMAFVPEDPAMGGGAATAPFQEALIMRHGLPFSGEWPMSAIRVSLPYDALLAGAPALGHVSVAVDDDGVVRRVPQFVRYGERVYPSMAFRVAMGARSDTTLPRLEVLDRHVRVEWSDGETMLIPLDDEGATAINFVGDRRSFRNTYSMIDVMRLYRDGDSQRLRAWFDDKLVLVGTTAVGEHATDIGPTPFASATPLVFIHANAANAVLEGRFLEQPSLPVIMLLFAVLAAVLGWFYMMLPLPLGIALAVATTLGLGAVDYGLFALRGYELPGTVSLVLPGLAFVVTEIYRRVLIDRHTRAQEREMAVARSIQQKLLPAAPPDVRELDVYGFNIPAQEVGGDYFDWLTLGEDRVAVCLGDVSGKGVAAALLMSHLRASFHAEARRPESPREIVEAMHESLFGATQPGRFATFFLALVPRNGGPVRYCNAGHNPAILMRNGEMRLIEATGLPLAMLDPGTVSYEEGELDFDVGDVLVLYSDGVTEAQLGEQLYGDDRLQALVPGLVERGLTAQEIADAILDDVKLFTHGDLDADDVTVVVVRRV